MFVIEISKIKIEIQNKYHYLERLCADYIINDTNFDISISVTEQEILEEQQRTTEKHSLGYVEAICTYRKICLAILRYDATLLHACTVRIDNYAYLFLAKSGTGKTTHCRLLKEYLGSRLSYINGDKPIIRLINGIPYAFGTPWNGKERYGENISAEIKALIFIERAKDNSIKLITKDELLPKIINQILLPSTEQEVTKTFDIVNAILNNTKQYLLKCNMDIEAAIVSYNAITK